MKPVVTYKQSADGIHIGYSAILIGLEGHPGQAAGTLVGKAVHTSPVQRILEVDGKVTEFETLNTIYRRRT